jgi:hypothetical protein
MGLYLGYLWEFRGEFHNKTPETIELIKPPR